MGAKYKWADLNGEFVWSEKDILDWYYPYWSDAMLTRTCRSPLITERNCIEDFIVVHWAIKIE